MKILRTGQSRVSSDSAPGGPEVLELVEAPEPGQIVIRTRATSNIWLRWTFAHTRLLNIFL